jgi:hypothetical protein
MNTVSPELQAALVAPTRHWSFRHELLDSDRQYKSQIELIDARVEHNSLADKVKRTAQFLIPASEAGKVNFASDLIRSFARLQRSDGVWEEMCVGTFMLSSSAERYVNQRLIGTNNETYSIPKQDSYTITGYDRLLVLVEDAITDRYYVIAGGTYRNVIVSVLGGEHMINMPYDGTTLPSDLEWPPGTSKLQIINDCLSAINYTTISADPYGIYTAMPYVSPEFAPVLWEYKVDRESVIIPGIDVELDLFNVPNTFVGYISDPDRPALRSVYINDDPNSLTSTVSRGRSIVQVIEPDQPQGQEELDQAATQALLDAKVQRVAEEATQQFLTAKFSTALMPIHNDSDVCLLDYGQGAAVFREHQWALEMKAGGSMSHEFRRVVSV